MIVWCDTETTGLDENNGHLLEVALVMTDDELKEGQSFSVVIDPGAGAWDWSKPRELFDSLAMDGLKLDDVVFEMHTKNKLFADIATKGVNILKAEYQLCEWFKERCSSPGTLPLAGSTIGFDKRWLRKHMPNLSDLFSYRSIDVSSITELARRWDTKVYDERPKGNKAHRALDDARESIAYLNYYRLCGFVGR